VDQAPALTVQPLRLFLFRGWDPHSLVNKIEPNDHFMTTLRQQRTLASAREADVKPSDPSFCLNALRTAHSAKGGKQVLSRLAPFAMHRAA
jgi:hypothetical protein